MRGTYIGPLAHLKGKTALLRRATHGHVVAQFDDIAATKSGRPIDPMDIHTDPPPDALGYGWHAFPEREFEVTDVNARG